MRGDYQLDHCFSIIQGYRLNVPAEYIGHVANLKWLLAEINNTKKDKCSITLEELMKAINEDN